MLTPTETLDPNDHALNTGPANLGPTESSSTMKRNHDVYHHKFWLQPSYRHEIEAGNSKVQYSYLYLTTTDRPRPPSVNPKFRHANEVPRDVLALVYDRRAWEDPDDRILQRLCHGANLPRPQLDSQTPGSGSLLLEAPGGIHRSLN